MGFQTGNNVAPGIQERKFQGNCGDLVRAAEEAAGQGGAVVLSHWK
jgi:hypothetical protein